MSAPATKIADLDDLAQGEDFGAQFADPAADWSAATPTLVLIAPNSGAELTPAGTTTVDGTEYTVTVLGSITENWLLGRWSYSFWIVNGGSRQYLATGRFRVYDPAGKTP